MANQLNRAIIACSALALAIVTLYYWQLRKRRKLPCDCVEADTSNSSVQTEHQTNEIREDCIESLNPENSCLANSSDESNTSLVSVIETADCFLGSGNDLSIEAKQSTIKLDNHSDIREDDTERISEATSTKPSNTTHLLSELEQTNSVGKQLKALSGLSSSFDITASEVSNQVTNNICDKTLESIVEISTMHMKSSEQFSPTFSNSSIESSDNDELACKFKHISISEESSLSNHIKIPSIDFETDSKSSHSILATKVVDKELKNNCKTEVCQTNGVDGEIPTSEIDEGNCESTLLQKTNECTSDNGLILNVNSDASAANFDATDINSADSSAIDDSDSRDTQRPHPQSSFTVQPLLAINSKRANELSLSTIKPNQTFAQALSSSSKHNSVQSQINQLTASLQTDSLEMSDNNAIGSLEQTKEETDVYHNYPDAAISSNEGQCSPNSEFGECSDVRSQGSNDSGKGSSDILHNDSTVNGDQSSSSPYHIVNIPDDQVICYQFEMPHYLCGKLIGSNGYFINSVKQKSHTHIVVNAHYYNPEYKICSVSGSKFNVLNALNLIRRRFPVKDYPNVSLNQINIINPIPTIPLSQACQLHLPPDIITDVILACSIDAGHFFLQQPTHPSYTQLNQLDYFMKEHYSQANAPQMPQVYAGIICAAPTEEGWYRALIKNVHESNTECDIMFVDYGGYVYNVPVSTLRQIRYDFLSLPFQASECYLTNVLPADAQKGWSEEATNYIRGLAQGQIIYATITGYEEDIPYVNLFKLDGSNRVYFNKELVEKGYGVWDLSTPETASPNLS